MKDLINLIDLETKKATLNADSTRIKYLKIIKHIIKKSRKRQQFIKSIINDIKILKIVIELLNLKINELEERITHEKMFFDKFSDTEDMREMYIHKLTFYHMLILDIRDVM